MLDNLSFKTDVLPFIAATAGEFTALYYWLQFLDQDRFLLANALLWAGFLVERISVYVWIRSVYRPKEGAASGADPLWKTATGLILITLSEVLIWIVWLKLADDFDFWFAAAALLLLMQGEHAMEMAILKRENIKKYLTNARTIFFTIMEVAGGVGWLYFVRNGEPIQGGLCLLVGLSIEHVLQGGQLKPEPTL